MQAKTASNPEPFVCSLEEARAFNGEDVIERFLRRFDVTEEQAQAFFDDVKQWLWLAALSRVERKTNVSGVPERLIIDTQMLIVDQMWHNFICFTKVYQNFCETHFGRMIHHLPTTDAQKAAILAKLQSNPEHQLTRKRIQYNYIYDKLGEDTLKRWYVEYPERYTPEEIIRFFRPPVAFRERAHIRQSPCNRRRKSFLAAEFGKNEQINWRRDLPGAMRSPEILHLFVSRPFEFGGDVQATILISHLSTRVQTIAGRGDFRHNGDALIFILKTILLVQIDEPVRNAGSLTGAVFKPPGKSANQAFLSSGHLGDVLFARSVIVRFPPPPFSHSQ